MISIPYTLIDKIIEKQKADRERNRLQVLSDLKNTLEELAPKYGFCMAFIFGSLVKMGKFGKESDIDIAIFNLKNENYFRLMGDISRRLGLEVDLYQIESMDSFMRKMVEEAGVLWKLEV